MRRTPIKTNMVFYMFPGLAFLVPRKRSTQVIENSCYMQGFRFPHFFCFLTSLVESSFVLAPFKSLIEKETVYSSFEFFVESFFLLAVFSI